jgi:hypothetical protein
MPALFPVIIIGRHKMKKAKISAYFLFISIITFAAIFIFIVQKSYDSLMKPINQAKISNTSKPIDPKLDTSVLDLITKRQYYSSVSATPPAVNPAPTQ